MKILKRLKPGVSKIWLYLLAGLMWTLVGLMLIRFAIRWMKVADISTLLLLVLGGIALALIIYFFGFSRFAEKNNARISSYRNEQICIFAFQAWTSYPLVAFMISLGIYLRLYSPFSELMLAIAYLGIGSSLFLASFHYYTQLIAIFQVNKKFISTNKK